MAENFNGIDEFTQRLENCSDIHAYLSNICESQNLKIKCARELRDNSLFCCGITNFGELEVDNVQDTNPHYPYNFAYYQNSPVKFSPTFVDEDTELTLQQIIDRGNYTGCYVNYQIVFELCSFYRPYVSQGSDDNIAIDLGLDIDLGPGDDDGGDDTEIGPEMTASPSVDAILEFDVYCNDVVIDTVQQNVKMPLIEGSSCALYPLDFPIKYEAGGCNLDNIEFKYKTFNTAEDVITGNFRLSEIYGHGASVSASCNSDNECIMDLKGSIPKTGQCADYRLFFIGYEYNQSILISILDEARRTLAACCDTDDVDTFFGCLGAPADISEFTQGFQMGLVYTNDAGQNLAQLIDGSSYQDCFFTIEGVFNVCATSNFTEGGGGPAFNATISRTVELRCGANTLDTQVISAPLSFNGNQLQTACQTVTFEHQMIWDAVTCDINDLVYVFGPMAVSGVPQGSGADPIATLINIEQELTDSCLSARCVEVI